MAIQKKYNVKLYDNEGNFVKTINDKDIQNFPPRFTEQINGGYGQLVIDLRGPDYNFDDFGEGTDIAHFHYVEVYAVKIDDETLTQTETLIYGGFLSRYTLYIDQNSNEGVKLTFLGWISILTKAYYKDGSSYTVTETSQDPAEIFESCITHFQSVFGGSHVFSDGNIDTVGQDVTIVFTDRKHKDVLSEAHKAADADWWWKVAADGEVFLKDKPASATHKFTFKRDVLEFTATKDSEKVINDVQVRYTGGSTYDASDSTSQGTYGFGSTPTGKHSKIISESGLDLAAATQRGDKEIADFKDAATATTATIGTEYDIESIHVGDTCKFINIDGSNTFFGDNLLIVQVEYYGDFVKITLERNITSFTLEMANLIE